MKKKDWPKSQPVEYVQWDVNLDTKRVASEAYQIIGVLADYAGVFDDPDVQNVLTYFGDVANGTPGDWGALEVLTFILGEE